MHRYSTGVHYAPLAKSRKVLQRGLGRAEGCRCSTGGGGASLFTPPRLNRGGRLLQVVQEDVGVPRTARLARSRL